MLGFMALGCQAAGKGWWQLGIDQKTHQATGSTGWSPWRKINLVAYLDRQRALVGYDVGEMDQAKRRIGL